MIVLDITYSTIGVVGDKYSTARFYDESVHGIILDGTPDQKITLSSNHLIIEASFFINVTYPYPGYEYQDYKDKGFTCAKTKQEGKLPAIAVYFYDFAGIAPIAQI